MLPFGTYKTRSCSNAMDPAVQLDSADRATRFDVGDLVVHPHCGVGRVVSNQCRRLAVSERSYLEIEFADRALTVMLPRESTAAAGLRPLAGPPEILHHRGARGTAGRAARELVDAREALSRQAQRRGRVRARRGGPRSQRTRRPGETHDQGAGAPRPRTKTPGRRARTRARTRPRASSPIHRRAHRRGD